MKQFSIYTWMLLLGVFTFSSCEDKDAVTGQEQTVSLEIPVAVSDMKLIGEGNVTTRYTPSSDEMSIHSLYVVQFNGTASTSITAYQGTVTQETNGKVYADFATIGNVGRVYVIANFTPSLVTGSTTLGTFEKMLATYTATTSAASVAASGLPMCGYADFNPATIAQAPAITLEAMVAKLLVTYKLGAGVSALFKGMPTIMLKNVASGTSFAKNTLTTAWQEDIAVGSVSDNQYTFYVPENIAGSNSVVDDWRKRTVANAPARALYFEITGRTADDTSTATIVSFIGDTTKPTEFNIYRNTCYTLTATITNLNTMDERITIIRDYWNLNVGGKSANCYIVLGNENGNNTTDYCFDYMVRGNNATGVAGINYNTLPDLSTAAEARVIWQTGAAIGSDAGVIKTVKLNTDNKKVVFTIGSAVKGNAVIGVFASPDVDAPCLWSWHIWRLASQPKDVLCVKTSATTKTDVEFNMMDRNLGAYNNIVDDIGSIGFLYQWGRKDPFPGPGEFNFRTEATVYGSYNKGDGTTGTWNGTYSVQRVSTSLNTGTELYAVSYPTVFIGTIDNNGFSDPWFWGDTPNDNLWGNPWIAANGDFNADNPNHGTKSIYDPCPIGYRVPPQDTWNKLPAGSQIAAGYFTNHGSYMPGMEASGTLWFPAQYYRRYYMGNLNPLNAVDESIGFYWSSSPMYDNPYAGAMCFNHLAAEDDPSTVTFDPHWWFSRAAGYSIRCVSEAVSD
ncbi:DUF4906 domain-containing protein [Bacteroides sp.]